MKKFSVRMLLCLALSALLSISLLMSSAFAAGPDGASDQPTKSPTVSRSNTTLLVYADDEQDELIALFLVADSPENGMLSIMSIPVNSRAIVKMKDGETSKTLNAPIRMAFSHGGEDRLSRLMDGVEMLFGGIVIDRMIAVSPENISAIIDAHGGMRVNSFDVPPVDIVNSPDGSNTYPAGSDNDNLALWLKRQASVRGATTGYDIETATLTSTITPQNLSSQDFTTIVLSGEQTRAMLGFTVFENHAGTDIMQIRRLQNALLWLLNASISGSEQMPKASNFLHYDEGESLLSRIAGYDRQKIDTCMVFPSGVDRVFAGESHWIFDDVWLHDWLMRCVYLK